MNTKVSRLSHRRIGKPPLWVRNSIADRCPDIHPLTHEQAVGILPTSCLNLSERTLNMKQRAEYETTGTGRATVDHAAIGGVYAGCKNRPSMAGFLLADPWSVLAEQ